MTSTTTGLQYQSSINVAGMLISCVESYESIFAQMRAANFKLSEANEAGGDDSVKMMEPLELTAQGPEGRPLRMAVQPHAIAYVIELPEDDRNDVVEPGQ